MIDGWIRKMLYVYTHTHTHTHTHNAHSEILCSHKKDEVVSFVIMWMDPEGIKLSKISQNEKEKYHMISLIYRN